MIWINFLDVSAINGVLQTVNTSSEALKTESKSLEKRLADITTELIRIKNECNGSVIPPCAQISTEGLVPNANFSKLPNVDSELQSIKDIVQQNFSGAADKVCSGFKKIWLCYKGQENNETLKCSKRCEFLIS